MRYVLQTLIWPRRRLLFLGLLLIAFNRMSALALPWATKYLLDDVVGQRDASMLRLLLTVVGVAVIVQAATSFSLTRLLSVEAQHLIAQLRVRVQRHVIRLPVGYFDRNASGNLVSRVMDDVEGVRNLIGTGLVQLVGGILTSVAALILLVRIDAWLTLIAIGPMVVFSFIAIKAFSFIRPVFRQRQKIRAQVAGRLTESLGGVRVVKGFHAEEQEDGVFRRGVEDLFLNIKKTLTANALVTSSATFLLGLVSIGIMGFGGQLMIEERMTTGDFVSFTLLLGFLILPIVQMASIGTQMTEAFAGLDRMEELLATPLEGSEPGRRITLDDVRGEIEFDHVSFAYQEGEHVLTDLSFRAPPGTVTALVGTSGSGKSTLAGLALSFLEPTRGAVRVDGVDLSTVRLDSYRSRIGVVLQDDFLFEGTIRENLLFARPAASDGDIARAVTAAHVDEFTDRFADGLETVIGERGVKLSGGQRQRVAIARALLADPQILVLDEATSSLDTESELLIQDSLAALLEGRTTFVIAHRLSTIRRADQILVIEAGQIVERGTHAELIAAEGRYHQLYTYQARI